MTPLGISDANTSSANTPLIVALFFGLAGAFYLGIYFIHRIRRRDAILKRHVRAEAYRVPDSPDDEHRAPRPYKSKLVPIDRKRLPPRVKPRATKGQAPRPFKSKQVPANPKGLPPPRAKAGRPAPS
jgi:hypothetical protein